MKKVSIFIKSYPGDYAWLGYCLRSIQKFVTGYHEIVVALPDGKGLPLTKERIVYVDESGFQRQHGAPSSGYYHQMFVKLCADIHCPDADFILIVDSDCVFNRPFDVSEMFFDEKPMLLCRPWSEAGGGVVWKKPAEEALGFEAAFDTMACHPGIYRREDFTALRAHIEELHHTTLKLYIQRCDRFIEFVTLGNFILKFRAEAYSIIETGPGDIYPRPLLQHWSWGGIDGEKHSELEGIVS